MYGELQLLPDNDAADSRNPQTPDSTAWRAVDAATGAWLLPDGKGTTPNSLKLEWEDGRWSWVSTREIHRSDRFYGCAFESITCSGTVKAPARSVLQALGFYRRSEEPGAYQGDSFYAHSGAAEKFFGCGGHFRHGVEAGIFCSHGTTGRTDTSPTRGFRSAYVPLPEGE